MKKRLLAGLLTLAMLFTLLPTGAFAAMNTGHTVAVKFTVLLISDEFNIGYNYGSSESTTFVCQYAVPHSDSAYNNHTIAESDIKAASERLTLPKGFVFTGWTKTASKNPTINPFKSFGSTACNKGDAIYIVAKRVYSYTVNHYYYTNGVLNGTTQRNVENIPRGTVISANNIAKLTTYGDGTYAYTSASPESATINDDSTVFNLRYDRYKYTINYDSQGGSAVESTIQFSTDKSADLNVTSAAPTKENYTFVGWAETAGATKADAQGSYTLTSSEPTKTLYAVWEQEPQTPTVAGNSTMNVTKKLVGIDSLPQDFSMTYSYTNLETNQLVTGTVQLTGSGDTLTGTISLPYYSNVETGKAYPLTITEKNADVDGYTMTISGDSSMHSIDQEANSFQYSISATTESTLNRTVTNTYTPISVPKVENIQKEVVADEQLVPDTIEEITNITYPTGDTITMPSGTDSVTLLYKVTVTGDSGASYTVLDEDAECVSGNATGTIPESGSVEVYFTRTFTGLAEGKNRCDNKASIQDTELSDTATVTVTVEPQTPPLPQKPEWANLKIEKTADPTTAKPGDTVTYTITVTNNTGKDLTDITVSEKLDENLIFDSASPNGQYNEISGIWKIPSLDNGEDATLTIEATVNESAVAGTITNTATITGAKDEDGNELPEDNRPSDSADITVAEPDTPPVDDTDWKGLTINKTADKAEVKPGETVTYTITVTNNTGKALTGITVSEKLDSDLTLKSASPADQYDQSKGIWTIPSLENGNDVALTIEAAVNADAKADTISNTATITGAKDEDGNELPEDNRPSNSADITVTEPNTPPVDDMDWNGLTINKTADPTTAKPGDTVTYTITVTNNTGKALTGVTVKDNLDGNLTFVSASPDGRYDEISGVWTIDELEDGKDTELKITATVNADAQVGDIIPNEAIIVSAADEDGNSLPEDEKPSSSADVTVVSGTDTPVGPTPGGDDKPTDPDTPVDPTPGGDDKPTDPDTPVDPTPGGDDKPTDPDTPVDPTPGGDDKPAGPDDGSGSSGGSGNDDSWVGPALALGAAAVAVPFIVHYYRDKTAEPPAEVVEEVPAEVPVEEAPVEEVPAEVIEAEPVPKTGDTTHPVALALGGAAMLALGGALSRKRRDDEDEDDER